MRPRYVVLALTAVCVAAALLFWQRRIHATRAAVTPFTAHLTITKNRVLPDGFFWNTVSTEVIARDRQGRIYGKTGRFFQNGEQRTESFSFSVQDPAKLQTLTWDSNNQVAVLAHWPYWSGRKGCWADEHGQHQVSFGDRYKLPASLGDGELETTSIQDLPGDKQLKTRVVTENLGQKEIHGLTASGMRITGTPLESRGLSAPPETTTEIWKSREFDFTLLKVTSGLRLGLERVELSDLQRGDPDSALFVPPQAYKFETIEYHQVPCGQQ
ncbi:MAG TPA: hypothetical protein VK638_13500 [Edaphobacter sp.]|nr:hypothetical protein [Edaphobacter sp.]